jgi:hypothetical protein
MGLHIGCKFIVRFCIHTLSAKMKAYMVDFFVIIYTMTMGFEREIEMEIGIELTPHGIF